MNLSNFSNNSEDINSNLEKSNNISISQLIKLCGDFKLTCLIKIISPGDQGFIFLKDGKPNNIKTDSEIKGEKAFTKILEWENTDSIIKKSIFPLNESVNILADTKTEKLNLKIASEDKYMLFCQNIIKSDDEFLSVAIFSLKDNRLVGYDFNQNSLNLEILLCFIEHEITINNKIQSLKNIFSKSKVDENFSTDRPITEYFTVNNFFQISKKLDNNFLISFVFNSEISKAFALKNLKKYSDELEKII